VALLVAEALEIPFTYANRIDTHADTLFPIEYRVPLVLRSEVSGRRTAIVTDVISAGSAAGGTLRDLLACGALPVAIGALAVVGDRPRLLAAEHSIPLEALASLSSAIWAPDECPLCAEGLPLTQEPPSA
jgi:orotate phosphoribosyltransferase